MSIPVQNIFRMLCYAWDLPHLHGWVPAGSEEAGHAGNLLTRFLAAAIERISRQGLHRAYAPRSRTAAAIRGQLLISPTVARAELPRGLATCRVHEWTTDTLPNQIVAATARRLAADRRVDTELRQRLAAAVRPLRAVSPLDLRGSHFARVQVGSHFAFYRFLLGICWLVHLAWIPDEESADDSVARSFEANEQLMGKIFERFVRNWIAEELPEAKLIPRQTSWQAVALNRTSDLDLLPQLEADVALSIDERILLIETKYYKKQLISGHRSDTARLRPAHLFQLHAYLTNFAAIHEGKEVRGLLLYPGLEGPPLDVRFRLQEQAVRVAQLDLDADWGDIEAQLRELVAAAG